MTPSSRSTECVSCGSTHDLQKRVNFVKNGRFLARFDGDLESSGNGGSSVRLEDVTAPSETDCPSRRRLPTGAVNAVALDSFSLNVESFVGGFSGGDAMDMAVPDMAVGGSEDAVKSVWVGDEVDGSCPELLWVSLVVE